MWLDIKHNYRPNTLTPQHEYKNVSWFSRLVIPIYNPQLPSRQPRKSSRQRFRSSTSNSHSDFLPETFENCRLGSKFIVWVVLTLQPSCRPWWMRPESSFLSSFFSNCLHRLPVSCYLWCCVAIVHSSWWPLLFHRDSIIFTTSRFQLGNSWKRWRGQSGKDQLGTFRKRRGVVFRIDMDCSRDKLGLLSSFWMVMLIVEGWMTLEDF